MNPENTEKKDIKKSQKKEKYIIGLKFYFLPIFTFIVFLLVIFYIVVPKINSIVKGLEDIEVSNIEIDNKLKNLTQIKKNNTNLDEIKAKLEEIDLIAPTGSIEVVEFRNKISNLAQNLGLTIIDQTFSEIINEENIGSTKNDIRIGEVPTRLEVSGNYTKIIEFIDAIEKTDDFLVFSEFEFNKSNSGNIWSLNLTLEKYQFSEDAESSAKYLNVNPNTKISEIVDNYLTKRLEKE